MFKFEHEVDRLEPNKSSLEELYQRYCATILECIKIWELLNAARRRWFGDLDSESRDTRERMLLIITPRFIRTPWHMHGHKVKIPLSRRQRDQKTWDVALEWSPLPREQFTAENGPRPGLSPVPKDNATRVTLEKWKKRYPNLSFGWHSWFDVMISKSGIIMEVDW